MRTAIVIGAGFAGLAAAASLASKGFKVKVFEKNDRPGGRAGIWRSHGYTFDLGPSFYWMPDVFESFFARFGERLSDHYQLVRLDPSYKVVFGANDEMSLPASREKLSDLFEKVEPGGARSLDRFLGEAKVKYDLGMSAAHKPSLSWLEYLEPRLLKGMLGTSVLTSLRKHVQAHFQDDRLRTLMEFPVLFLGAAPGKIPAMYSLMNYADMELGTWYPMGGMSSVVDSMARLATSQGAQFHFDEPVIGSVTESGTIVHVKTTKGQYPCDVVVATADYHHVERSLLKENERSYSDRFWEGQAMAPSVMMFYLGFDRKLPRLEHHTLFFDRPMDAHLAEVHDDPRWPTDPLFHVCCPSRTDPSVAPPGHENVVVLIPIAAGLEDTPAYREHYFQLVMDRLSQFTGIDLRSALVVQRSYSINDLISDHNAFRGNAYGLANTLGQTGPLRPKVKSRKISNLYYAGQLTVPGPGVPPALISGQIAADLIASSKYEMQ